MKQGLFSVSCGFLKYEIIAGTKMLSGKNPMHWNSSRSSVLKRNVLGTWKSTTAMTAPLQVSSKQLTRRESGQMALREGSEISVGTITIYLGKALCFFTKRSRRRVCISWDPSRMLKPPERKCEWS